MLYHSNRMHDAVVSKLIVTSRGSPCDSMASCCCLQVRDPPVPVSIRSTTVVRVTKYTGDHTSCAFNNMRLSIDYYVSICIMYASNCRIGSFGCRVASLRPKLSFNFYRAMHFSAKRGIAIACRPSVCLSVCLSVRL